MKKFRKLQNKQASSFNQFCFNTGFHILKRALKKEQENVTEDLENQQPNINPTDAVDDTKLKWLQDLRSQSTFKKKKLFDTEIGQAIRLSSGSCF